MLSLFSSISKQKFLYHNFKDFEEALSESNLFQIVKFSTWSRMVGNVMRTSILDFIYVTDPTVVSGLKFTHPYFGDHVMIEFCVNAINVRNEPIKMRDWHNFSKELLNERLLNADWNFEIDDVQQFWNMFEGSLISVQVFL